MSFSANMTTGMIRQLQENPGTPIRQASVAVFTVDSADRQQFGLDGFRSDKTPINHFLISKPQTLINGYFTRVALTEINIPWAVPNVNARNNTFTITLLSGEPYDGEYTVSVPEAFYTPSALATALEDALNAKMVAIGADGEYVFDITIADQVFTIANTAAGLAVFAIIPKNLNAKDDLCNLMGFAGLSTVAGFPNFVHTYIGSYASMLYTPYFDIVSNNLTKKQQVADSGSSQTTGRSLLARIYLAPFGIQAIQSNADEDKIVGCRPFTIHYEFQNPKQIYWDTQEFINVIDLSLEDYKGNVLYESAPVLNGTTSYTLGSGSTNWQMTFQVSET